MVDINKQSSSLTKTILVGFLLGLLLNIFGWLGNNIILGDMWAELGTTLPPVAWRESVWSDVFSLLPDFIYGIGIAWLIVQLCPTNESIISVSIKVGIFVSLLGGITTYFAIANSGFITWDLAIASFVLVLSCKVPLAVLGGYLLVKPPQHTDL